MLPRLAPLLVISLSVACVGERENNETKKTSSGAEYEVTQLPDHAFQQEVRALTEAENSEIIRFAAGLLPLATLYGLSPADYESHAQFLDAIFASWTLDTGSNRLAEDSVEK